ncbi:hypothetical protein D5F01_LYC09242 [Larimichthys crocea]|uniref:Uncharacterized protein n=2 Tax=Larimichthys crocea TaxID=215358 RepID=A0A6G0IKU0_LARCR|nr:hypothetical protein D5F01_LYC09242 [Larimichthys crocea]
MGVLPSDKSRGFGRSAVMAAAGGAVAGMALGYGLGRFPRPHFEFHSPQEEYYYNHYMYRKYGVKSTDTNDYSRDYNYSPPPQTYDSFMDTCVKRKDLLPEENQQPNKKTAATTTTITTTAPTSETTTSTTKTTTTTAALDTGIGSNTTKSNSTAAYNSSTSTPPTPHPLNQTKVDPVPSTSQVLQKTATDDDDAGMDNNTTKSNNTAVDDSSTPAPSTRSLNQPKADPVPPTSQVLQKTATNDDDDDDDTVSIVEIGYPALIKQLKVRRCVELYIVYSEKYLKKNTKPSASNGVQGLEMGLQGLLTVVTSIIMMALNSNMLLQQH